MAQETKQEEKKVEARSGAGTFLKVVLGLAFLAAALYLLLVRQWWGYTWLLIKGGAAPFLVLAGIITLAIAKE